MGYFDTGASQGGESIVKLPPSQTEVSNSGTMSTLGVIGGTLSTLSTVYKIANSSILETLSAQTGIDISGYTAEIQAGVNSAVETVTAVGEATVGTITSAAESVATSVSELAGNMLQFVEDGAAAVDDFVADVTVDAVLEALPEVALFLL